MNDIPLARATDAKKEREERIKDLQEKIRLSPGEVIELELLLKRKWGC